ncbi:hypothetical protein GUJ93_ZPchr0005g15573 [Zizania palustris]|uniref:Uncharacterized protein n=1 Tax=Zizania palustris TaxID=103762 RepID=A0A8J5SXN4_ZIZPA|nr:hypothetical protein GUJ93_ZPchr0005g15573 [Zizania palustris]
MTTLATPFARKFTIPSMATTTRLSSLTMKMCYCLASSTATRTATTTRFIVSHDMLLYGAHDDGKLDVLLPSAHDVIYDNLQYNQDVSHDWLNELDEEDFNELLSG